MKRYSMTAALLGLAALTLVVSSRSHAADRLSIGTNVAGLDDFSVEFTFSDVFKQSRQWFSGTAAAWEDRRPLDLDEHGWVRSLQPGQVARALMFWDLSGAPGAYPAGRYVVTYQGWGTIDYWRTARVV